MARKNSEVKVKFVAETQDINNGLKSTQNEIKVLNSRLSLNAEKLKGASGDTNLLSERTNLLSDALAETQKKTELMNVKLQKAKELFGEDSKEVKDLESALNYNMRSEQKLQNEIDKCNAELNKQSDVTEDVCDSTEATGEALADFTESMDSAGAKSVEFGDLLKANLASDLIRTGVEKLTDAVGSFAEKAVSGQKALNNFQGKTGMAADKMQEFEDIMYNVYMDNFGEGLEDIADVMATIHQQTGQTGDELQNTTERAILLRDTFGWEVSESIRAANSMMNQFGISSEEAFDLMVQGAQKGLDQNDDLLDTINEYSVQFKDAGYSAQDMFNMLANGAESGTWSIDKLGDAVKEYHIRWQDSSADEALESLGYNVDAMKQKVNEGGEAAGQAMQDVIASLMKVEDEQERYQLGQALMGTMWEDLGETAVQALMDTRGDISLTSSALEDLNHVKYDDLGSAVAGIGRKIEGEVLPKVQDELIPVLETVADKVDFEAIGDGIVTVIDEVETLGGCIADNVDFEAIGNGIDVAVNGLKDYGQYIMENKESFEVLAGMLAGAAAGMATYNAAMKVAEFLTPILAGETAALNVSLLATAGVFAAVVGAGILIWQNWDYLKAKAIELKDGVVNEFEALKTGAIDKATMLKDSATQKFESLKSGAINKVTSLKTSAINGFENLKSGAVAKVEGLKSAAIQKFDSIKSGITSKINGAKDAVKGAIDRIKGFFHFTWSLPPLKLPEITITGKFSLGPPPTVPHFGIAWHADGGLFNGPTVLHGLGEAGPEYALPLNRTSLAPLADMLGDMIGGRFDQCIDYKKLENIIQRNSKKEYYFSMNRREFLRLMEE